jgi:Lipocalin-like domain
MKTHSRMLMTFGALLLALTTATTVTPAAREPETVLQGVWRTVEVVVQGPAPRTMRPEATLAIFHGRHYSRVEVHAEQPRPPLGDQTTASADQLRAVWGPFVGEAGTFELTGGNVLTMHATVAKNPAAMTSGASSVYTYRRNGNRLTLEQVRTAAGPSASPVTITLTRVE